MTSRRILLWSGLTFAFYFPASIHAQLDSLPSGIYLSLEQLKSRQPASTARLQVIVRSTIDMAMNGGNVFKLSDNGDSLRRKYLKQDIYAYVEDNSLYLNSYALKLGYWYCLVAERGEFIVFNAVAPPGEEAVPVAAMFGGAIGGAIAGAAAAHNRHLYILSTKTGNSRRLSKEYLIARLKDRGKRDLTDKFGSEPDQENEQILLKYVHLLNTSLAH